MMGKSRTILAELLSFPLFPEAAEVQAADQEAETEERRPSDWVEREKALDVSRSWIVEAPAGSGKTGLLIQRYLKLLLDERVAEPEQILAITFTKAATEEIRERVLRELERAGEGGAAPGQRLTGFQAATGELARRVLERDGRLGWRLREQRQRINVRTIDSVCAEIAQSLPVLTRGAGRQTPQADAAPLYQGAARRTVLRLGGEDARLHAALRLVLLHRDGNVLDCEGLIAEMLKHRDQWGELVPLGPGELTDEYLEGTVLPRLNRALDGAVCAVLTEIGRAVPEDFLRRLSLAAAEMAHLEGYQGEVSPLAMCAGEQEAPEEKAEHLERWRALIHLLVAPSLKDWRKGFNKNQIRFEAGKTERERLKELVAEVQHRDDLLELLCSVQDLPPAMYPPEQWEVAKALFRILSHALVELQMVFAEAGECDFAEVALLARAALRSEGGMRQFEAATGRELEHLLIDEMQDTSTGQYELIELLTQGWQGEGQTLFLVGDPKQSIYLFRQARVERFVETMRTERLGGVRVGRLRLSENFRSQAGLVDATNSDFARVFPRPEEAVRPEQVPFVAATAARPRARGEGGTEVGGTGDAETGGVETGAALGAVWHTAVLPAGRDGEAARRRRQSKREAEEVRRVIEAWHARPLPGGRTEPWTIAVLVRARRDLREILPVLKRDDGAGAIPFRAVEIDALNERQEVLDLHALTRALLHGADRMAWLAVLRAPWCGFAMAELHLLTGAEDPAYREWCIEDLLAERGELLGPESCRRLERVWPVLEAASRRPELPLAERVERTWRSLGGDAYLGREEQANTEQYLRLLREVEEADGVVEVRELERRMQRLFAEPSTEPGAVDLMTIHKAKGLEWDVVLVPEMDRPSPVMRGRLLAWEELTSGNEGAAHVVVAPVAGKGAPAKELNRWIGGLSRAREAAERKRLFYVAATRAREELHLFAAVQRRANGEFSAASGSMLHAAWGAAKLHFAESGAEAVIEFPAPDLGAAEEPGVLAALAAGEELESEKPFGATIERLPVSYDPASRYRGVIRLSYGEPTVERGAAPFDRPEGSVEARSLGNAVHAFLELATKRVGAGVTVEALLGEVRGWTPRIEALLRADGLAPGAIARLARQVGAALEGTLRDPVGRWIVAPHREAMTEAQRTTWAEGRSSIRVDRSFRGGAEPMAEGDDCLWIVDYKTSTHGAIGMGSFLAREKETYRGQMEEYARVLGGDAAVRVALYYPLPGRLVWWVPGE